MMRPFLVVGLAFCLAVTASPAQCIWGNYGGGDTGTAPYIAGTAVYDDGSGPALYAAGSFTTLGGVAVSRVAKWDGATWSPLGQGLNTLATTLAVFNDGTGDALYVAGFFSMAGGQPANKIAKWDGTSWSPVGTGMDGAVNALHVWNDGTGPALYAGGSFQTAGGVPCSRIAKWDGAFWSPVGLGVDGVISVMADYDDGSGRALYTGGQMVNAGAGVPAPNIARWDGTAWSGVGGGHNSPVWGMAVYDDGSGPKLFCVGYFTSFMSYWDGFVWNIPAGGLGAYATVLTVYDEGFGTGPELYIGGTFFAVGGGIPANRLAKWDGTAFQTVGMGCDNAIRTMTVAPSINGPELVIGGQFTMANGAAAGGIASYACGSTITLGLSQPAGPTTPVLIENSNLIPGSIYYNMFSLTPCAGGPGTGPWLGLCAPDPTPLVSLFLSPVGTEPIHFKAGSHYLNFGPYQLPPLTVDGVCFEYNGTLGGISPAVRLIIQ